MIGYIKSLLNSKCWAKDDCSEKIYHYHKGSGKMIWEKHYLEKITNNVGLFQKYSNLNKWKELATSSCKDIDKSLSIFKSVLSWGNIK